MENNIQILGLDSFNDKEKDKIINYVEKYSDKIFRNIKGNMVMHAKKHEKDGNRANYSFHIRIQTPETLISVKDDDWILSTALNKALKKVENNIIHKFKVKGK
jgi:ribosome-associated translation inhibitor RaiA